MSTTSCEIADAAVLDNVLGPRYFWPDTTLAIRLKPTQPSLPLPPELREIIFANCDTATIQQLRLVNRQTEADASQFLFTTLVVGIKKRYLRRLQRIAADPKFARGVKEVICEMAQYTAKQNELDLCTADAVGELLFRLCTAEQAPMPYDDILGENIDPNDWQALSDAQRETWKQKSAVGLARYLSLQKGEEQLLTNSDPITHAMSVQIQYLEELRKVTMTVWAAGSKARKFFEISSLTGSGNMMPPPFLAGDDEWASIDMQDASTIAIDWAVLMGGLKVEEFQVIPTSKISLAPLAEDYELPSIMILTRCGDMETNADAMNRTYRSVKDLRLDLSNFGNKRNIVEALRRLRHSSTRLMPFFGPLYNVQSLSLNLRAQGDAFGDHVSTLVTIGSAFQWRVLLQLRHVTLTNFWVEPADLCNFLIAHADTLETVRLENINLGGTEVGPFYRNGGGKLARVPRLPMRHDGPLCASERNRWDQVASTCRSLLNLRDLLITRPTVGEQWKLLGKADLEAFDKFDEFEMKVENGNFEDLQIGCTWGFSWTGISRPAGAHD
ncbi:hypothetical protein LTR17_001257 [Elasticomyces elasticus]|nr:hypothetical protein LTR17_001257 [Elasticomyces elasticus]